jgi:hypothetical protein
VTAGGGPPVVAPPVIAPPGAAAPLRDRGGFLIFLGIVEIALGALFAAVGLLMLLAGAMTRPAGDAMLPVQRMAVVVNLIVYLGSALFLLVMGIGTMQVRRWARVLMLMVSWSFLGAAILGIVGMGLFLPGILAGMDTGSSDTAAVRVILAIVMAVVAGVMIGMPLFFVLAYGGRHVRHTFATRHPEPIWVDRCPTSVLAISLVMTLFGLMQIAGSWTDLSLLFGVALSGPAAIAANLVLGACWIGLGLGLFRLNRAAWLASLAFTALIHLSAFLAYRSVSFLELLYRLGAGAGEASAVGGVAPLIERWSGVFALVSGAVWIVSLLSVRRHFQGGATPVAGPH